MLKRKWADHDALQERMAQIVRQYGLGGRAAERMERGMGVERYEVTGRHYRAVHNDCIDETARMEENSVDLIVTSIPFSNHYEYSPSYNDFGHNENTERFSDRWDICRRIFCGCLGPDGCCAAMSRIACCSDRRRARACRRLIRFMPIRSGISCRRASGTWA